MNTVHVLYMLNILNIDTGCSSPIKQLNSQFLQAPVCLCACFSVSTASLYCRTANIHVQWLAILNHEFV